MANTRGQCWNIAVNAVMLTTVFLTIIAWTSSCVLANESNGIEEWYELHKIPDNEHTSRDSEERIWKPVSQGLGIRDTVATVGRVFKYAIPRDSFRGDVSRYQITEAGKEQLPDWLVFNSESETLEGIPAETDMDQFYISVVAHGKSSNSSTSKASDVFSVTVIPDSQQDATTVLPIEHSPPMRGVKCMDGEPGVTATIVLDADWRQLGARQRLESISKMSQNSRLGVEQFRLLPIGSKGLLGGSVLVAGPGNVQRPEHPGVALSWQIGCGTDASKFPVVTILELSSKDGSMADRLGHNIIGWHVTNDKTNKAKRVRRQARLMGTPVPTPMPTDMPLKPTATLVVPSTRVVPTQVSPSVMPPKMTQSMIGTIAPTRSFIPMESTRIMPTPDMISPTPAPDRDAPILFKIFPSRLDATALTYFRYRIPGHMFHDSKDGYTRKLKLTMREFDSGDELPEDSWVQFNQTTQTIEGLPFKEHVGREPYFIIAQNSRGRIVKAQFELVVKPQPDEPPPVTMAMVLDIDYDKFIKSRSMQKDILDKIASVFGDRDPTSISFIDIGRGSVVLSWTNNTIDNCNGELIDALFSKLVYEENPTPELIDALKPYKITKVNAATTGICASTTREVPYRDTTQSTMITGPGGKDNVSSGGTSMVKIIVPVIIALIIIIIFIIAVIFILRRRRSRKHKLAQVDQKTFGSKGIPIIFAGEREDGDKPPTSSSPLIMREEKPPLAPPDYSSPNKNNSRNKNSGRQNVPMVEISGSSPYKRPPPLATSTPDARSGRPTKKPAYRAPPAYVPP